MNGSFFVSKRSLRVLASALLSAGLLLGAGTSVFAQDKPAEATKTAEGGVETLQVDPVHSSLVFRVKHNNVSYVFGEIVDKKGTFKFDPKNPEKSSFSVEAAVESIQTHNEQRNDHLKSPDFFNAKQFPKLTFKSTSVKKRSGETFEVTGDLTIHGQTKKVTTLVQMTGTGQNQEGKKLRGFYSTMNIKRSDFGMDFMIDGGVSDEVKLFLAFETIADDAK